MTNSMATRARALTAVLTCACVFASPVAATTPRDQMDEIRQRGEWCAAHEKNVVDIFTKHTDPADDAGWADSIKAYDRTARAENSCDGHDDYVNAYLDAWDGQILHHRGQDWKAKMADADRLLAACADKNAGTDRGTKCAADLKANTARETDWQAP